MKLENNQTDPVLSSLDSPIILEFHGNHCHPCLTQQDMLAFAAAHPAFPARLVSVNIDEAPKEAARFNVTSVPTVLLLNEGRIVARHTGLIDPGSVTSALGEDRLPARGSMASAASG